MPISPLLSHGVHTLGRNTVTQDKQTTVSENEDGATGVSMLTRIDVEEKQQTCSSPQTKISECLLLHCLAISPSASICQLSVRERRFIDPHCRFHIYLCRSYLYRRKKIHWSTYLVPVTSFEGKRISTNPGESPLTFGNRNFETFFCCCCWKQKCDATNLFEFSNQFQICNQGELRANLGRETDRFQEEILGAF